MTRVGPTWTVLAPVGSKWLASIVGTWGDGVDKIWKWKNGSLSCLLEYHMPGLMGSIVCVYV